METDTYRLQEPPYVEISFFFTHTHLSDDSEEADGTAEVGGLLGHTEQACCCCVQLHLFSHSDTFVSAPRTKPVHLFTFTAPL